MENSNSFTERDWDVLVLGAGVAGLAAASTLLDAGKSVLIIEARDRIGGRIFTRRDGAIPIEFGAEFVHGRPAELWRLIDEAHLQADEMEGIHFCYDGKSVSDCGHALEQDWKCIEDLAHWNGDDRSFADYIHTIDIPARTRERLTAYIEGFNAADQHRIGIAGLARQQAAENAIEGFRGFRLREGYAKIPELLECKIRNAGGNLLLSTRVHSIEWRRGCVSVGCAREDGTGASFQGRKAIITLPLGVIQSNEIQWSPEPAAALRAAARLQMGQVCKATLRFKERFWAEQQFNLPEQMDRMAFLHSFGQSPPIWWTRFPDPAPVLIAWSGGTRSERDRALFLDRSGQALIGALALALGIDTKRLEHLTEGCHVHDWQQDPFARGAYSYVPAGALDAVHTLTEPVGDTLLFAGEHTDERGHWGTVHGALSSGLRAAKQILRG